MNYLKNKDTVNQLCADLDLNPLLRPEQIAPEMYLRISEYLNSDK